MTVQELWNLSYALEERANFCSDQQRRVRLFAASCELSDLALAVQRGCNMKATLGVSLVANYADGMLADSSVQEDESFSDAAIDFERINLYA